MLCILGPVLSNVSFKMAEHSIRQRFRVPENQAIQMAEMDFVDFCRVVHMAYEFMTGKETTLNEMLEHHIKTKYIRTQTPIFIQNQWMERDNEKIFGGGYGRITPIARKSWSRTAFAAEMLKGLNMLWIFL